MKKIITKENYNDVSLLYFFGYVILGTMDWIDPMYKIVLMIGALVTIFIQVYNFIVNINERRKKIRNKSKFSKKGTKELFCLLYIYIN